MCVVNLQGELQLHAGAERLCGIRWEVTEGDEAEDLWIIHIAVVVIVI